jgi:hypothetical protein
MTMRIPRGNNSGARHDTVRREANMRVFGGLEIVRSRSGRRRWLGQCDLPLEQSRQSLLTVFGNATHFLDSRFASRLVVCGNLNRSARPYFDVNGPCKMKCPCVDGTRKWNPLLGLAQLERCRAYIKPGRKPLLARKRQLVERVSGPDRFPVSNIPV